MQVRERALVGLIGLLLVLLVAGCGGTAVEPTPYPSEVDWETAIEILNSGDVEMAAQLHSLEVILTLKDGTASSRHHLDPPRTGPDERETDRRQLLQFQHLIDPSRSLINTQWRRPPPPPAKMNHRQPARIYIHDEITVCRQPVFIGVRAGIWNISHRVWLCIWVLALFSRRKGLLKPMKGFRCRKTDDR